MGWLKTWSYRRNVSVDNSSGAAHTDFPVKLELTSSNFTFANAESDGSDVRVTQLDGTTLLSHWIQDWDDGAETGTVWVKVPSILRQSL